MNRNIAWIPALALMLVFGCGKDGKQPDFADLNSVKGVVKKGGQPVKGGQVIFTADPEKPEFGCNSVVGADGTFTLTTYRTTDRSGERKNGAPAGNYKVTYIPDLADQTAGGALEPIPYRKPVTITSGANDLTIDLSAK